MEDLGPQFYRDFSSGQINNLNITLKPKNSVELMFNMDADYEIGSATSRLGTVQVGAQLVASKSILGLHQHVNPTTPASNLLFAALNVAGDTTATIKNVANGSDVVTGLTASTKVRFLTYNGSTLAINGVDGERAWNESAWITTAGVFDLGDYPGSNTCSVVEEYLDRIWTAGDTSKPHRVHYSTIFDGSVITWDGSYVDIEPEDGGGKITALTKVPGYLLVFKERSMKRLSTENANPESLVDIGTPSQEAVVRGGGLVAFYSGSNEDAKGFYITNGGRPECISQDGTRPIKKWVDAITSDVAVAGWATEKAFNWSIGDVTVDGESFTNIVLKYNRKLRQWTVRSYPTEFKVFSKYITSSINGVAGGDNDGNVMHVDVPATHTDAPSATAIPWKLRTNNDTFNYNQTKEITDKVVTRGSNINGSEIAVLIDEDTTNRRTMQPRGILGKILQFFNISDTIQGTTLSVEVKGETHGARAYLREIEISKIKINRSYGDE